jgi:hypothetical protein
MANALLLLDQIAEDPNQFDQISSPNYFVFVALTGFANAHDVVLDWRIFEQAVGRWPKSPIVWLTYAKFVAVYPSETQRLVQILHTVSAMRLHGAAIPCVKEGATTIIRRREQLLLQRLLQHERPFTISYICETTTAPSTPQPSRETYATVSIEPTENPTRNSHFGEYRSRENQTTSRMSSWSTSAVTRGVL